MCYPFNSANSVSAVGTHVVVWGHLISPRSGTVYNHKQFGVEDQSHTSVCWVTSECCLIQWFDEECSVLQSGMQSCCYGLVYSDKDQSIAKAWNFSFVINCGCSLRSSRDNKVPSRNLALWLISSRQTYYVCFDSCCALLGTTQGTASVVTAMGTDSFLTPHNMSFSTAGILLQVLAKWRRCKYVFWSVFFAVNNQVL